LVLIFVFDTVGEIVSSPRSRRSNSAQIAEKPLRATLLAEPFPGAVAQGVVLVFTQEMKALRFGQNQMLTQFRVLRMHGSSRWVASIFAAVGITIPTTLHPLAIGW
jgi:hypothetical protein